MTTPTIGKLTASKGTLTESPGPEVAAPPAEPIKKVDPRPIPEEYREAVAEFGDKLLERAKMSLGQRLEERMAALETARLGEPTVGPYNAFDLYAFTPVQFGGPPPYQPSKIIAGGEFAVIYAVMFVNPTIDVPHGFAVQPTVQLSERWWRVGMEQVNLTDVSDGPDDARIDQFAPPEAPAYTLLSFGFYAPKPTGLKPLLFEANLSADIINMGQPYAAFASTIIDVDKWLIQENIPLRYLVYTK
ncbi:hypothetical protein [Actinoplanes sp. NPDC049599]|uniref:hypothetical protein n=1 Tax=Actinoplanes sp. NPDC049599 TaxID=3363903 RepID=UPI0037A67D7F